MIGHDIEEQLATVWKALEAYQDACLIPPSDHEEDSNEIWDDLCLAMAVIRERLDLPSETAPAFESGPDINRGAQTLETIEDIKRAVDRGHDVRCNGGSYRVLKDSIGQYLIQFLPERDNYVGLHGRAGTKYADHLNGQQFYIKVQA